MNNVELKNFLDALPYPGLSRTLGELKLVDSTRIDETKATIVLSTVSDESYLSVKQAILNTLSNRFSTIDVQQKLAPAKDINYGSTATPNNRAPYAKNIIAVTSGKGGVGKSTLSVNIAVGLAQKGYKVGLLDADIYGPNTPRMLGIELERMRWNDENKIIPSENFGIKVMSVGLTTPAEDTPLVWRSSVAVSALIQFLEDVAWGNLDFMVIDMPPGTGDIQLTMAEELPITTAVMVTTPQTVATDDVSRAIRMYQDIHVPMAGIVENMSYFIAPDTLKRYDIFGVGGGALVAKKYGLKLLGEIPLTIDAREASDEGKPAIAMGSDVLKESYRKIVDEILKEKNIRI
ncbi:MAG: ATP-binding protein [Sulfuricurvum sp. PC08-66]|nr:MAG: ATP-binding protein [Sulfuricurvum sp. PC08-66]